jgi:hypothetical protein
MEITIAATSFLNLGGERNLYLKDSVSSVNSKHRGGVRIYEVLEVRRRRCNG